MRALLLVSIVVLALGAAAGSAQGDWRTYGVANRVSPNGVWQRAYGRMGYGWYSVYGDYRTNSPPSAIIGAVARGDIDVAAAWGPMAGYFAAQQAVPLDVSPVQPQVDGRFLPQTFSIAMATRRRDEIRHEQLQQFIDRRRSEIDAILAQYHVPRVDRGPGGSAPPVEQAQEGTR